MLNPDEVNWREIVVDGGGFKSSNIFANNTVLSARYTW